MQQAERGIFDLRRGRPVYLRADRSGLLCMALESVTPSHLRELATWATASPRLVLSGQRAKSLGLRPEPADAIALSIPAGATIDDLLALAGTAMPDAMPDTAHQNADTLEQAALNLARAGRLLPAMLCVPVGARPVATLKPLLDDATILTIPLTQAMALASDGEATLSLISQASIPLEGAPRTRFLVFREDNGVHEHVAVLIGDPDGWDDPVPLRLHSACLTGDLFGSLRCDCGDQLRGSVHTINAQGGGVLLYLAQEGRGIGLANKLRAYTLQEQGLDTVDADRTLGFDDDERRYDVAVAMLNEIGVSRVRLYTNNPEKVTALAGGGIHVVDRRPLHGTVNPHNRRYLDTKASRAGHWLADLLASRNTGGS